jgi:hypothetical protein
MKPVSFRRREQRGRERGGPGLTQTNVYYRNFDRVLITSSTIDVIIDFITLDGYVTENVLKSSETYYLDGEK